jgi:hypothetical protein
MDYTEKFAKNGKLLESAGRPAGVQMSFVSGGRAYVSVGDAAASIVDLASGQVVASAPRNLPYLIDALEPLAK